MVEERARADRVPERNTQIHVLPVQILSRGCADLAMTVLFGHPTGNPNSHHAATAYLEAGLLEGLCVPWMPSATTTRLLEPFGLSRPLARRLERRQFPPLSRTTKVQGRAWEICRLLMRASGLGADRTPDLGNRWLMRTMARECHRSRVTAVHAYEDCSLWPFREAKRLGKSCVYDMPTCYYPAWQRVEAELQRTYADWLPPNGSSAATDVRLEQKRQEMALADVTLVASRYVENTIREFYPDKAIARAPYGVDVEFWTPGPRPPSGPLRFIYAGQVSLRKGVPLLID